MATKLHKSYMLPKTIFYRSYNKFDDQTFIDDVKNIPFSVCDIFDDEDDRYLSDFHNFTCMATKLHKSYMLPKTIFYRSYNKFDDQTFIDDVKNIPFSVCDIFDDEDDRLWSFSKLLSGIIDCNAPVKKKVLKKPSVPYMNSRLRKAILRWIPHTNASDAEHWCFLWFAPEHTVE